MSVHPFNPFVPIYLSILEKLEFKDCSLTNASSFLGSKSLAMLYLEQFAMYPTKDDISNKFTSYAELFSFTTLTTIHLNNVPLCCTDIDGCLDPFVNCANLKNLNLNEMFFLFDLCHESFVISAPQLWNLSLMCNHFKCKIVRAAPRLTNFTYLYSWPSVCF